MQEVGKQVREALGHLTVADAKVLAFRHTDRRDMIHTLLSNVNQLLATILVLTRQQEATHATIARSRETPG